MKPQTVAEMFKARLRVANALAPHKEKYARVVCDLMVAEFGTERLKDHAYHVVAASVAAVDYEVWMEMLKFKAKTPPKKGRKQ